MFYSCFYLLIELYEDKTSIDVCIRYNLNKNTYTDWILEICDDGSTDRTLEIIGEYQEQYPDKILLHRNEENQGVTVNFLEGAKRAQGEYVMFCDQDDVWLPEKIEKTLHFMKEQEKMEGENSE